MGQLVKISIDCPGAPLPVSAFMPPADNAQAKQISGLEIMAGENGADTLTHIVLTLPAAAQNAPRAPEPDIFMGAVPTPSELAV